MILTANDPDGVVACCVTAGVIVIWDVAERHGWRLGRVCYRYGHHWEIGRLLA